MIRAFDAEHAELSLAEVARRSGIARATARRILHTLEDLATSGCGRTGLH